MAQIQQQQQQQVGGINWGVVAIYTAVAIGLGTGVFLYFKLIRARKHQDMNLLLAHLRTKWNQQATIQNGKVSWETGGKSTSTADDDPKAPKTQVVFTPEGDIAIQILTLDKANMVGKYFFNAKNPEKSLLKIGSTKWKGDIFGGVFTALGQNNLWKS
jgi:hypothetical protein